jgi:hypothetical protein
MTDEDLMAIFAYLRTVKPVRHNVDNSEEVMTLYLWQIRPQAS